MKTTILRIINKLGYNIKKYPATEHRRRINLLQINNISTVIDIGANVGQYAKELRSLGYKNRIVSFEPLSKAYEQLQLAASRDPHWEAVNLAIGNEDEKNTINISSASASSSILNMKGNYISDAAKEVYYIGSETITVRKLDTIFNKYFNFEKESIFLKIDAQGYESKILDGAEECIRFIKGLQIEMSLKELYDGETLIIPMLNRLYDLGFEMKGIEQGFFDPSTMELFQVDGIFYKK